ncbi:hypothetical protein NQ314_000051 [Rhamnusium bicolor]|uniref:Beta-sarcoglycan n=1 Tax=Rhamnusium bicolor TaxID=1586634 RepID=A0AAV8ZZH8_9CUCU|nr:hypothetical protein NQ314_000051 [Rhamnusium bicolor]
MLDSPPTSDVFSDEMDSVSIRDKTLLNRSVPKHNNNNNFKAGYLLVETKKASYERTKNLCFLDTGMESIELIPEGTIKLFGNVDLDHIYKRDGKLEGYDDEPVEIASEDSSIEVKLYSRIGQAVTKLKIDKNETVFKAINSFDVKNENDESIFTIIDPVFTSLKSGKNLKSKRIQTNKIRSPSDENLKIEGDKLHLKGAEGTKIEGREIVWSADQDIYLSSNGSIVLNGTEGVFIDVKRIPIAKLNSNNYIKGQFKVCVCIPGGKLFRIPVDNPNDRVYCHHVNMQQNPCI